MSDCLPIHDAMLTFLASPTQKRRDSWPNSVRLAYHTTSQLEK